jgi:cyclopropane fatty-acyl-phospholipid synthase-like methyltransferase
MANPIKTLRKKIKWWLATPAQRRHSLVGPIRDWEKKRAFQILFLKKIGLKPEHYVMDVGCGTLRGGIPIIKYLEPEHYVGLESREPVLTEARKELREHALEHKKPRLVHSPSLLDVTLEQRFDFVWAFSVLIHMRDDILDDCLLMVKRHLKDSGAFYVNVNLGEKREGHWQGFPVVYRTLPFYQEAARRRGLEAEDLGQSRTFYASNIRAQDEKHILKFIHARH